MVISRLETKICSRVIKRELVLPVLEGCYSRSAISHRTEMKRVIRPILNLRGGYRYLVVGTVLPGIVHSVTAPGVFTGHHELEAWHLST